MHIHRLLLSLLVGAACLTGLSESKGQSARLSGPVLNIDPDLFGYNVNHFNGAIPWSDQQYREAVTRLHPGNLRYPGGTVSNYWDWRTGGVIETINSGWPRYLPDDPTHTIADFVNGIPEEASAIYCINMARPTPATGISANSSYEVLSSQATLDAKIVDILAAVDAFYEAGYPLKYVELGNEFYIGAVGGVDGQGGVYSGDTDLYINHANQIAQAIVDAYPEVEIAIIGDSDWDGKGREWNQDMYRALEEGTLNNIDAITFHWYAGPGVSQLNNAQDAMESLSVPFGKAENIKNRDYDSAPEDLKLWITEYNTWSDPDPSDSIQQADNVVPGGPIQGTWVNGMFGANLGLLYTLMGEKIDLLNVHVLSVGKNIQWSMMTNATTLSGNGVAVGAIGQATQGMTKAQRLAFDNIPNPTFSGGNPSVYGAKFWNNERESVVIINNANQAKNGINIDALFSADTPRQLTQHYDLTPWDRVSETNGITRVDKESLGDQLDAPPFSISVIMAASTTSRPSTSVVVRAKGQTGEEKLELLSDGKKVGSTQTVTTALADYRFSVEEMGTLRVAFVNDGRTDKNQDRNLFVDKITVGEQVFQAEDQLTNTGSWNEGRCGGVPSSWLYCGGYIEFAYTGQATPLSGFYKLRNRRYSLWLDGDSDQTVKLSSNSGNDKNWQFSHQSGQVYQLKNEKHQRWLDADRSGEVDISDERQGLDRQWILEEVGAGAYRLKSREHGQWLRAGSGNSVALGEAAGAESEWQLVRADNQSIPSNDAGLTRSAFAIYPNPTEGQLHIQGSQQDYQMSLLDLSGRVMMRHGSLRGTVRLDVGHVRPGLYVVKVRDAQGLEVRRRIIIK